ncbi:unnamed protein product [Amoebophrya sp. A120]|nr:unnamed protein product [Amoebophrya sp. A120]|eukprot:GSA120T00019539001.1
MHDSAAPALVDPHGWSFALDDVPAARPSREANPPLKDNEMKMVAVVANQPPSSTTASTAAPPSSAAVKSTTAAEEPSREAETEDPLEDRKINEKSSPAEGTKLAARDGLEDAAGGAAGVSSKGSAGASKVSAASAPQHDQRNKNQHDSTSNLAAQPGMVKSKIEPKPKPQKALHQQPLVICDRLSPRNTLRITAEAADDGGRETPHFQACPDFPEINDLEVHDGGGGAPEEAEAASAWVTSRSACSPTFSRSSSSSGFNFFTSTTSPEQIADGNDAKGEQGCFVSESDDSSSEQDDEKNDGGTVIPTPTFTLLRSRAPLPNNRRLVFTPKKAAAGIKNNCRVGGSSQEGDHAQKKRALSAPDGGASDARKKYTTCRHGGGIGKNVEESRKTFKSRRSRRSRNRSGSGSSSGAGAQLAVDGGEVDENEDAPLLTRKKNRNTVLAIGDGGRSSNIALNLSSGSRSTAAKRERQAVLAEATGAGNREVNVVASSSNYIKENCNQATSQSGSGVPPGAERGHQSDGFFRKAASESVVAKTGASTAGRSAGADDPSTSRQHFSFLQGSSRDPTNKGSVDHDNINQGPLHGNPTATREKQEHSLTTHDKNISRTAAMIRRNVLLRIQEQNVQKQEKRRHQFRQVFFVSIFLSMAIAVCCAFCWDLFCYSCVNLNAKSLARNYFPNSMIDAIRRHNPTWLPRRRPPIQNKSNLFARAGKKLVHQFRSDFLASHSSNDFSKWKKSLKNAISLMKSHFARLDREMEVVAQRLDYENRKRENRWSVADKAIDRAVVVGDFLWRHGGRRLFLGREDQSTSKGTTNTSTTPRTDHHQMESGQQEERNFFRAGSRRAPSRDLVEGAHQHEHDRAYRESSGSVSNRSSTLDATPAAGQRGQEVDEQTPASRTSRGAQLAGFVRRWFSRSK